MATVLVTGAARGLGLEFVRQYAADGWQVHACARDPAATALGELSRERPGLIRTHALDLTQANDIRRLAGELADAAIDVLINCAGTMGRKGFDGGGMTAGAFGKSDYEEWQDIFQLNVFAPMQMAEAFVGQVARSEQKKIITLTSILGSIARNSLGGLYAYRASKAAVNAIMHSMAIDLGRRHGIIAIPLHPGWVRTDMGGQRADIDAPQSVAGMRRVIAGLDRDRSGRCWMYDGSELPW
ncbi:MAG: SDR family oxidoreductase [Steroidobacteraceae bacterium]